MNKKRPRRGTGDDFEGEKWTGEIKNKIPK